MAIVHVDRQYDRDEVVYRSYNPDLPPNTFTLGVTYGNFNSLEELRSKGFSNYLLDSEWERMKRELETVGKTTVDVEAAFKIR